jgi:hypothetical protein
MEWLGTNFVLTLGGVRLRVRIALEDTPHDAAAHEMAADAAREDRGHGRPARPAYRVHPR